MLEKLRNIKETNPILHVEPQQIPNIVFQTVTNGDGWSIEIPVCLLCDEYVEDCRCI